MQNISFKNGNLYLKKVNALLIGINIGVAFLIGFGPFLPNIEWFFKNSMPLAAPNVGLELPKDIPSENTLVIPSLQLKQPVYEGTSADTLEKGIWRRPNTTTPEQKGNTVFVGHRFTFAGASVFYHLDKVKVSDPITVYWNGKQYSYVVSDIKEVAADEVSVERQTDDTRLTLYTCTPLTTADKRLVITALPSGDTQ